MGAPRRRAACSVIKSAWNIQPVMRRWERALFDASVSMWVTVMKSDAHRHVVHVENFKHWVEKNQVLFICFFSSTASVRRAAWTMQPAMQIAPCTPGPTQSFVVLLVLRDFRFYLGYYVQPTCIFSEPFLNLLPRYHSLPCIRCVLWRNHIQIWPLSSRTRLVWYIYIYILKIVFPYFFLINLMLLLL